MWELIEAIAYPDNYAIRIERDGSLTVLPIADLPKGARLR